MTILAVDDEILALNNLERHIKVLLPEADFVSFTAEEDALAWLCDHTARIALLDIHIGSMGGILLAKQLREKCPDCSVIFVTGYSEYAVTAFAMKVSGYLMKPVSREELKRELDYALGTDFPVQGSPASDRITVQCFGSFEVFCGGKTVYFPRKKSKELFAYLVDRRGAQASMAELASVLWEDGKYDLSRNNQIHTFIHDLVKALSAVSGEEIILKKRNAVSIDTAKIDCDYYAFLAGDAQAVRTYRGEYMSQYWWAEFTIGGMTPAKHV